MLQLQFSPFPVLETNRLILRRMVEEDVDAIYALRSNPEVMKYIPKTCESREVALEFFKTIDNNLMKNEGITWAIAMKENPSKMIGSIGIWRFQPENFRGEVGYYLLPDFWRKGILKEALRPVLEFAFGKIGLHSIEAIIDPENIASENLLVAFDFKKEAHFRENFFYQGKFLDSVIYSLLKKEFSV